MCERNLDRLIARAEERNNFLWIDMESSPYVDPTLELFRRSRAKTSRIGIALQAYLYRTAKDIESLMPLGPAIRIVKGAYLEPRASPIRRRPTSTRTSTNSARGSSRRMPSRLARSLHIATHDVALADRLIAFIDREKLPQSAYEFAMLYGIQRSQQLRLAGMGKRVRVLISYGEYWFPWYMRRLAERPANIWFVVKNIGG